METSSEIGTPGVKRESPAGARRTPERREGPEDFSGPSVTGKGSLAVAPHRASIEVMIFCPALSS